jgi:hypothetical protein
MGSSSFWTEWLEAGIGGGLSTTLRLGLKCGSLESKFGRRPGTHDRSGTGWSHSCLGCGRGVCFSGYLARHINSRITISAWRYGLTVLWHRSKNWHMKDGKMILISQPLLDNRTGAYIEGWIMNLTWLLIISWNKDSLLELLSTNKDPQAIKPIIILESREIYSQSGKSCDYIMYSGFIYPCCRCYLRS